MFNHKSLASAFALLTLSLIAVALAQTAAKAEDDEEAAFATQARKLGASSTPKERLAALEWLIARYSQPAAAKVMPDIERCLKKDADAAVRAKAATALGLIAYKGKPCVCPLAVVEALRDRNQEVRDRSLDVAGLFKEFAPGSVDILLRCAKEGDRNLRAGVMTMLAAAGGQEEKVIKFIRKATEDDDLLIRNNAYAALYKATGKLEDLVPYCLRVQLEFHNLPLLTRGEAEEKKLERTSKELIQWGALARLHEFEEKRGEELAKIVLGQLNQPSARARRAAAFLIGEYPALLERLKRDAPQLLIVPGDKKDDPPPPRLLNRLRAMNVEDQLRKLAKDDGDKQVRAASASALEKLAGRNEKRP